MPHLPQPVRGRAFAAHRATRRITTEAPETPAPRRKRASLEATSTVETPVNVEVLAADANN